MKIRVVRSGRKHKVGNARIIAALAGAGPPMQDGNKLVFTGEDHSGVELEIIPVPDSTGRADWAVIHAMPTAWRRKHVD